MSDVIGKGVIEVSADSTKLKAGIDDAKRSIKGFGDAATEATGKASKSIDRYVKGLDDQRKMLNMSTREQELYKLMLRGASEAQLKAANATLTFTDSQKKLNEIGGKVGDTLKRGLIAGALAAGVAAVAIASSIKSAVDAADHLNDLSKKTGIAVETLGGLGFAAGQAGGDLESVASAAGKLNKSIAEAGSGSKEYGAAFSVMGINVRDASGDLKKADVVMAEIATKFAGYEDGPEKAAIALKLFGKAGADIIPLLNDGGKALADNVEYYKKYSGVTQETADKADAFNDTMGKISLLSGGLSRTLAAELLPSMQSIADEMLKSKENGDGVITLIRSIAQEVNKLVAQLIIGAREAGGFWNAIGTLGTINPFRSLQSNISSYRDDLKEAQTDLEKFKKAGKDTAPVEASIGRTQAKLNFLLSQQSAEALAGSDGNYSNEARVAAPKTKTDKKTAAPALPGAAGAKVKDTAKQEAAAQLTLDLDQIRKGAAAEAEIYSNAEKIMEAMHSANLIDDKKYYAEKLGYIQLHSQAQEAGLLKEIERLKAEDLTGKAGIDNARKLVDAEAKLAKVRADSAVNVEINGIQSVSANDKVIKSYQDAKIAAEAYLETVKKQNAREVAGIGKGQRFRDEQGGLSQIEDKQTSERQNLERDKRNKVITQEEFDTYLAIVNDTYAKEVELYGKRTQDIKALQADGLSGATEAMQNYLDASANMAAQTEGLVSNAFQGMEDALVNFAMTGKLSFGDLAKSIIADLVRIQAKAAISGILKMIGGAGGMESLTGSGTNSLGALNGGGNIVGLATGGPAAAGSLHEVNEQGPELLTTGGKTFLMMGSQAGVVTPNNKIGGGGSTIAPTYNINIDSRSDRQQVMSDVQKAVRQGNAELVDQLSRAGKI